MKLVNRLTPILFQFFLFYLIVAYGLVLLFDSFLYPIEWYDLYLLFVLLTLFYTKAWFLSNSKMTWLNLLRKNKIISFTFIFALLYFLIFSRLLTLETITLWQDEVTEIVLTNTHLPTAACAGQSQPPLGCLLTRFGQIIQPQQTVFAVRLHVALANALSGLLLFTLIFKITRNYLFTTFCLGFYMAHPLVQQYSYEVRPISLGLLTSLFFLHALIDVLNVRSDRHKNKLYFNLFSSAVVFLMSLGFQAPILILATFIYLMGLSYFKKWDQKNLILAAILFFSVMAYLPLQIAQFQTSIMARVLKLKSLSEFWSENPIRHFSNVIYKNNFSLIFMQLVIVVYLVTLLKKKTVLKQEDNFKFMASIYILFYVLFFILFKFLLESSYIIHERYLIISWPLILVSSSYLFNLFKNHRRILFSALLIYLSLNFMAELQKTHKVFFRYDSKKVYTWANTNLNPYDTLTKYCFRFFANDCWSNYKENSEVPFYFTNRFLKADVTDRLSYPSVFQHFLNHSPLGSLHFWVETDPDKAPFDLLDLLETIQDTSYTKIDDEFLFTFHGSKSQQLKNWATFLSKIQTLQPQFPHVYEFKFQLALIEKNSADLLWAFERWVEADKFSAAQDSRRSVYWNYLANHFSSDDVHIKKILKIKDENSPKLN